MLFGHRTLNAAQNRSEARSATSTPNIAPERSQAHTEASRGHTDRFSGLTHSQAGTILIQGTDRRTDRPDAQIKHTDQAQQTADRPRQTGPPEQKVRKPRRTFPRGIHTVGGVVPYFVWGLWVCVISGFCVEYVLDCCWCDGWLCFLGFVL